MDWQFVEVLGIVIAFHRRRGMAAGGLCDRMALGSLRLIKGAPGVQVKRLQLCPQGLVTDHDHAPTLAVTPTGCEASNSMSPKIRSAKPTMLIKA